MRRVNLEAIDPRRALRPAFVVGMGVLLCTTVLGEWFGEVTLVEAVAFAVALFAVVLAALLLGGRRGVFVVWAVMLGLWLAVIFAALDEGRWNVAEAAMLLPSRFAVWSFVALPLAAATTLFLSGGPARPRPWRSVVPALVVWLGLVVASSHLASYALDVGGHPLQNPWILWAVGVLLPPAPFLLSCRLMLRLHGRGE